MRDIIISIRNNLVAEAITRSLTESGEFRPFKLLFTKENEVVRECGIISPELLLLEVAFGKNTDFNTRLSEAKKVRSSLPNCKIVFLCDENSSPEIAKQVIMAKKEGQIDEFLYASVGSRYLVAALSAL
jgi:DNA-binding NarL/FixJ family response regulator